MKILFITDLYPVKSDEKTTPRTLMNFVECWRKTGYEVDVIKPNFILNSFLRKKPFYKQGNYNGVLNLNFWMPFCGRIKQPEKSYDIVIAHMPSGILYADKLGLPFVAGIHSSDLTVLTNPLYKIYFKKRMEKALENAKAIACRSFVLKEKFLKLYPHFEAKTFAAPSGIDDDIINTGVQSSRNSIVDEPCPLTPTPSPEGRGENLKTGLPSCALQSKIKILTCANYKKRKNIEKVLAALDGLEGFELTVIGQGTDNSRLRKLNKNAVFKGYMPHEKVLEQMRKSDIFILPSVGETFGMVYLEAMASGCITVCTEGDGIDGIIKNGENGFTVKPNVNDIKKLFLQIKNTDTDTLKLLLEKSFDTARQYTGMACSENYLQQIFKIM